MYEDHDLDQVLLNAAEELDRHELLTMLVLGRSEELVADGKLDVVATVTLIERVLELALPPQ